MADGEGPVVLRVGERSPKDKKYATDEYLYADPGVGGQVIVAPRRRGEAPTMANAVRAVMRQSKKGKLKGAQRGAAFGGGLGRGTQYAQLSPTFDALQRRMSPGFLPISPAAGGPPPPTPVGPPETAPAPGVGTRPRPSADQGRGLRTPQMLDAIRARIGLGSPAVPPDVDPDGQRQMLMDKWTLLMDGISSRMGNTPQGEALVQYLANIRDRIFARMGGEPFSPGGEGAGGPPYAGFRDIQQIGPFRAGPQGFAASVRR